MTATPPAMVQLSRGTGTPVSGHATMPASRRGAVVALIAFLGLLVLLPLLAQYDQTFAIADSLYRAGSLVFGGGHVV